MNMHILHQLIYLHINVVNIVKLMNMLNVCSRLSFSLISLTLCRSIYYNELL